MRVAANHDPMIFSACRSKRLRRRAFIAAVSAVAFAILVSVAATHLHIGLDADDACAVCAAVIGKLEGPSAPPAAAPPVSIPQFRLPPLVDPLLADIALVVLPPSCGPPRFA